MAHRVGNINVDEELGITKKQREFLDKHMKKLNEELPNIIKKMGFKGIEKSALPVIEIWPSQIAIDTSHYDSIKNKIVLYENYMDNVTLHEEIAHFLRNYLLGKNESPLVGEFYGFLGRRLANKNYSENIDYSEKLKELKNTSIYNKSQLEREKILSHMNGYRIASEINLDDIGDIKKFYSLPTKEVQEKIIRPILRKNLVNKLEKISGLIFGIILSLSLLNLRITGNIVGNLYTNNYSWVGIFVSLIGLLFILSKKIIKTRQRHT